MHGVMKTNASIPWCLLESRSVLIGVVFLLLFYCKKVVPILGTKSGTQKWASKTGVPPVLNVSCLLVALSYNLLHSQYKLAIM